MGANEPGQIIHLFAERFNAGDGEAILELYEDDAVLVPEPGASVQGKAAIAEVLSGFLALGGTMTIEQSAEFVSGDIALTHNTWRIEPKEGDALTGQTAEVARRQDDGTWKYALDNPWGGAVLG